MQLIKIEEETLTNIADAIRGKNKAAQTYTPEEMATAIGEIDTGAVELNIAYGSTAPEDTTKLWVKADPPPKIYVKAKVVEGYRDVQSVGSMPQAAMQIRAVTVGTKVYLFGGAYGSSFQYSIDAITVLDTTGNTISTLSAKLPVGAADIGAAVVGTKIYLFGGYGDHYVNSIYVFDTQTDTISTLSTKLPVAATRIGAAAIGSKIYLFGGCYAYISDYGDYVKTIWEFDTETNSISTLDVTLPTARPYHAAAVGTKIYLFEETISDNSTIRVFDVESNTISELDIIARAPDAIAVGGTKIYILNRYTEIQVFDTECGTISVLDVKMPSSRYNVGATMAGTKLYRFGGYGGGLYSSINMFDTEAVIYLDAGDLLVEIQEGNAFQLLPGMEIGVANVYLGNGEGYAEKTVAAVYKDGSWEEL